MPEDRFAGINRQNARRRFAASEDRDAEAHVAKGEYRCKQCRNWYTMSAFQYEYKGEPKVARRCRGCRRR